MKILLGIVSLVVIVGGLMWFFLISKKLGEPVRGTTVTIENFSFAPDNLVVTKGTTVTWTNRDAVRHSIVSDSGYAVMNSELFGKGEVFSVTFSEAGTFPYHCGPHSFMRATITVQ